MNPFVQCVTSFLKNEATPTDLRITLEGMGPLNDDEVEIIVDTLSDLVSCNRLTQEEYKAVLNSVFKAQTQSRTLKANRSRIDEDDHTLLKGALAENNTENPALTHLSSTANPSIGEVVKNRFVLESLIAEGGMGSVFKARDLVKEEAQERNPYIALKTLNREFKNHPLSFMSLARESRKTQSLAHPNIVNVFDFDRDNDLVFMTMELLQGQPLGELIKQNLVHGIPVDQALNYTKQTAAALQYAHEKGVLHCDLKPQNIFITDDSVVKVLDFGIARANRLLENNVNEHTQFDAGVLGALSPGYASREIHERLDPEPSDDVYALACITYQLLTGKHPFDHKAANTILEEYENLKAPAGLKKRQWQALKKGLSIQRKYRTQSIKEFVNGVCGETTPGWIDYKIAAAAVLAVAVGLALFGSYNLYSNAKIAGLQDELDSGDTARVNPALQAVPDQASIAVLPFADLSADGDQQFFVEGLSEEIIHALAQVDDLKVAARTSTFRLAESGADISSIASDLGVAHVLEGSVRKSGDQIRITAQLVEAGTGFQVWSNIFDRTSEDIFGVQNDISIAVAGSLKETIIGESQIQLANQSTLSMEAYEEYLQARFYHNRSTIDSLHSAIAAYERAIALDANYAEAYSGLSEAYSVLELYSTARIGQSPDGNDGPQLDPRVVAEQGLVNAQKAVELAPESGMAHSALGKALVKRGQWAEAISEFNIALDLSPGYAPAHSGMGLAKLYTGSKEEALGYLIEAKELDPESQSIAVSLGMALHSNDRTAEAVEELRIGTRLDPNWYPGWSFLSIVATEAEDYDEALRAISRRVELQGMELEATQEVIADMENRIDAIRRFKESGEPQEFQVSLYGSFDMLALSYHRAAAGQLDRSLFLFGALVLAGVYESSAALHVLFLEELMADDQRYQSLLTQSGIGIPVL